MRISFLCNSFLALPSIQFLNSEQCLVGLAASSRNHILSEQMALFSQEVQVPYAGITPQTIKSDLTNWMAATHPDVVLVQTFPHLIPASCLSIPPLGFYNLHPSPLPAYRGPDPIFWQLANKEKNSGVTLHKMSASFDTGPIFHVEPIPLDANDTYGLVQSNLSFAAVEAIKQFLACEHPEEKLTRQSEACSSAQCKPQTQDLIINWDQATAPDVEALVRACNPHQNGAITFFRDVMTRALEVNIKTLERVPRLLPGSVIAADADRGLQVLCADQLALDLNILHVDEGYYTGRQFCEVFNVGLGEKFSTPSFLS